MLLAVDIGNTNINFGVFKSTRLIKKFRLRTKEASPFLKLKKLLRGLHIEHVLICSVVPRCNHLFEKYLKEITDKNPLVVGRDVIIPIKNLYRHPQQVGQDRLVNAYAAACIYGVPAIVVDFGTAITFDVISKKSEYLGGMIMPGIGISLESLAAKTALLPHVVMEKPRFYIGKDTRESIISGVVYGFAASVNTLVKNIKKELRYGTMKIIGTGGDIVFMKPFLKTVQYVDIDLTLKGLRLIANNK